MAQQNYITGLCYRETIILVMPKNRPGPAGAYKLCYRWLKRV